MYLLKMNPVIFSIGKVSIKWYSLFILIGIVIALIYCKLETKKYNISWDFYFNLAFWTIIVGFIGARLYYVLFNFSDYANDPISILKIWQGGLAIHGGIIAGLITIILYCKKYAARTLRMTDIAVVPLLIAQALGRWGNFFNNEAHGPVTSLAKLQSAHLPKFIIDGMLDDGLYYTPTFLYESVWCLIGFIILMIVKHYKYLKVGQLTAIYLMWYSLGRFFIEGLRTDSLMLGGFKVAQIVSIILFIVGMLIFMILSKKTKFEDLYSEKNADNIHF
ncbi:MAG: prolipoprotein diacylglyceryl transferase [Bacilli bacterium]|nr:prolipoprotein diacylglyceryl transferase [Bacilli bacterium]